MTDEEEHESFLAGFAWEFAIDMWYQCRAEGWPLDGQPEATYVIEKPEK